MRISVGVFAGVKRLIRTGAISSRPPVSLGLATSTTQPSTKTTPRPPGATGAAMASLCSLAARKPTEVIAMRLAAIIGADRRLNLKVIAAMATRGTAAAHAIHVAGSTLRPR